MTKPTWTDELKQEAIETYLERIREFPEEERPAKTNDIVMQIAEEFGFSKNSVRAHLQRAKTEDGEPVYVKAKPAPKAKAGGESGSTGGKKMSKADAQAELVASLKDGGAEVEDELTEIIEKMTGKAAQALAGAIRSMS